MLYSKHGIVVRFPSLSCRWSETPLSPQAGQFMIDSHHCYTCTRVRLTDDFAPVRIVDRFRPTEGKITVQYIDNIKINNMLIGERVLETNSLITASHPKRFHADTLVTVTRHPGLSDPVHLSHVFTAPWTYKILLT